MELFAVRNSIRKLAVPLALLAASTFSAGPAMAASPSAVVVRVPSQALAQVAAAAVHPAQALDYGSFQWLEVESADLARLDARGVSYVLVPDARQVRVPGFRFDPLLDGEPELPAGPARRRLPPRLPAGPVLRAAQGRLALPDRRGGRAGPPVLPAQHLPGVGRAVGQRSRRGLEFVRWQGAFHPAYKVNTDLRGRTGTIANVDVMFYDDGDRKATLDALTQARSPDPAGLPVAAGRRLLRRHPPPRRQGAGRRGRARQRPVARV